MAFSWGFKPLAIASAVAFSTLGLLSKRCQRARFYFHSTLFFSSLGAASIWGLIITVLAAATGERFNLNYYVGHTFYRICHPLVGIDFDIEGQEHLDNLLTGDNGKSQSAVIIGNHQSMVDMLYLGAVFPKRTSIMAKRQLKYSPILGQYMALSGAVFVNRAGSRADALQTITKAGLDMKRHGMSIWIFPEGTRASHAEPTLLPFKKGAFHLAIQAQVPVIIVVCENYHHLFDGKTRFDSGRLRVKILPPIPTTGMTADDAAALTETARDLMLATLKEISAPPPKRAIADTPEMKSPQTVASTDDESAKSDSLVVKSIESLRSKTSTEDEMDDDAVVLKHPN